MACDRGIYDEKLHPGEGGVFGNIENKLESLDEKTPSRNTNNQQPTTNNQQLNALVRPVLNQADSSTDQCRNADPSTAEYTAP